MTYSFSSYYKLTSVFGENLASILTSSMPKTVLRTENEN